VPGIVLPGKVTVKGAPAARRLLRNRTPLSNDLARQVLGTYRKDGAERGVRMPSIYYFSGDSAIKCARVGHSVYKYAYSDEG
jgi:hypothetical protein